MLNCSRSTCRKHLNLVSTKQRLCYTHPKNPFHTRPSNENYARTKAFIPSARKYAARSVISEQYNTKRRYESNTLPTQAKAVICGGGVMGAAVAYHLAIKGLGHQVVLLEQERYKYNIFSLKICRKFNCFSHVDTSLELVAA